jgi:hypothetical protein
MHRQRWPRINVDERQYGKLNNPIQMPVFTSLSTNLPIRQDSCALVDAAWQRGGLTAVFSISAMDAPNPQAVRVIFKEIIVMRIVDEMIYSLEERGTDVGITRDGFAYEVTESPFLQTLSEASKTWCNNPKQYTFIGMDDCLDVIAAHPPQFDLVDLKPWLNSAGL